MNNIFGVDIDQQAVEVTKLSLLLKVLEDENLEYKEKLFKTEQLHMLPDLSANIKCGNSLIGSDYYADKNMEMFGNTEMRKVNVFDWEKSFPPPLSRSDISPKKDGGEKKVVEWGFDCVIGNPPYVRQELLGDEFKKYAKKYETYAGTADLYVFFIEKAHKLLKQGGSFGFIVANKWMKANYGQALRKFISTKTTIKQIIDFGELPVFQGASTFPAIVITENNKPSDKQGFIYAPIKKLNFDNLTAEIGRIEININEKALGEDNWTLVSGESVNIIEKMRKAGIPLGEYVDGKIYYGIKTGLNEAFVIDEETKNRLIEEDQKSAELIKPFANGDDIRKYEIKDKGRYLIVIPQGWTNKQTKETNKWLWFERNYQAITNHLKSFEEKARKRCDQGDYWWELRSCDYLNEFEKSKIVYPDIAKESRFSFDEKSYFVTNTAYFIPNSDLQLTGILNSKVVWFYYKNIAAALGDVNKGGRLRFFTQYMLTLPIPTEYKSKKFDEILKQRINSLKDSNNCKSDNDKKMIQQKIDAVDSQIDRLVYELYGLSEDEIRIVEGG